MTPADTLRLASHLKRQIGGHLPLIGSDVDDAEYWSARARSDRAQSLARYLVQHLADRDAAALLARSAGIPGALT